MDEFSIRYSVGYITDVMVKIKRRLLRHGVRAFDHRLVEVKSIYIASVCTAHAKCAVYAHDRPRYSVPEAYPMRSVGGVLISLP